MSSKFCLLAAALFSALPVFGNTPPAAPVINEPGADGQVVNPNKMPASSSSAFRKLIGLMVQIPLLFSALCFIAEAQPYGLATRPNVNAYYDNTFPADAPAIPANWSTVLAFPDLMFLNPVGLAPVPGTNKLIVWEREGKIWIFDNDPATTVKTLVVDLSGQCQGWDDSGLLGVALHPNFAVNKQMFVYYNWRGGITGGVGDEGPIIGNPTTRPPTNLQTRNRLSRFVLNASFQTSLSDEYIVIDQKDQSVWHNGGGMFFHPQNGFLHLTNGDDANGGTTQRIDRSLFSCVMRIDVDQIGGSVSHAPTKRAFDEVSPTWPRYFVPNSNPFVGQPNALEEIFAIGLRSPHRMTIDPVTGRIFIGDVGAGSREEISVIEPNDPLGLNFQWDRIEGKGGNLPAPFIGTNKPPIIDYAHSGNDGSCVIGGYVYRGQLFPELSGKYLFGDNMTGKVWILDESVNPPVKVLLATLPDGPGPNSGNDYRGLGSFGLDAAGEIYLCRLSSTDGRIYKLQRGGPPPGTPLPATLGATGFFSDLATLTPSNRLLPYEINAPFWSDRAVKKRFAAIPNNTTIGFQPTGDWAFPTGSVFVKHFDLPVSDVNTAARRRIETRFIVKKPDGSIYGATYKWRDNQLDADLLDSALTESIPIATASIGNFVGQDIGNPALSGSTTRVGNEITITAGGTDIWGTSDQFHFAHQLRSGNFDISVRVESASQADLYTKTGLMVRESLDANAKHIMALVFPSNAARNNNVGGYEFQYRATTGGGAVALYPPQPQPRVNYPDTWLRLQRSGDTFIAYSGSDGSNWQEYARTTLAMPAEIRFGLAVTAHTGSPRTTAKFQVETRRQPWYFPSRQDCITCHTSQSGGVLGLSTRQLNREMLFQNGVTDNQVRTWNHAGIFENGPPEGTIPALEKLHHHTDVTASLEDRARSYLDANCSSCHRPGGAHAFWDARFQTPLSQQGIVYGLVTNNLGNPESRVVVPQNLLHSILHKRVSIVGAEQMPPVGRNLVDDAGVAMLTQWIQGIQPEDVAPPANLAGVVVSKTQVNLTWQDLSTNEAGFAIDRSFDNLAFTQLATVGPGVTSFNDTTAEPFTTHYYRVRAFATYVSSPSSNIVSVVTNVGPPAPEVRLTGNGQQIPNNDFVPTTADGTDFGGASLPDGAVIRTFFVGNIGNSPLQLSGTPRVAISGANASSFTVIAQPAASVPGPGAMSFQIQFSPDSTGTKTANVAIASNDSDEPITTFAIRGTGSAQNLIAWWKFDETTGSIASDSSGAGHTGTLTGPPPQWAANGLIDGAINFTGELDQSVTIPDSAELNPTSNITIAGWVFPFDWAGNRRILQKGNGDNQYRLLAEGGNLVWDIAGVGRLQTNLPPPNDWVHMAATYGAETMRIYINGVQVASQPAVGPIPVTGDPLYLGTKTPGSVAGDHFNGYLDDLRLYASALSAGEINTLVAEGNGTSSSPVINTFAASPVTIQPGQTSTLTWSTQAADNVTLLPGFGSVPTNGTQNVTLNSAQTYTLTATNSAGSTSATVTVNVATSGEVAYQWFRFTPTKLRNDAAANSVQLAEFDLYRGATEITGATATNPNRDGAANEDATKAVDQNLNTKWNDFNKGQLILQYPAAVIIDRYGFVTANDADARDPVSWTLEGSSNGATWTLLHSVTDHATSTNRFTNVGPFLIPAQPQRVLFVVANATNPNLSEVNIATAVTALGYTVEFVTDSLSTTANAAGKSLILIASSVTSSQVNTKFRDVAIPIVNWESALFDDLAMTGLTAGTDLGTTGGQTALVITNPSHPLAAGQTGQKEVFGVSGTMTWGNPNANAARVASVVGNPNQAAIFAYETGASMVGLNAPARRVGLFLNDTSGEALTGNGTSFLERAIVWATNAAPQISFTAPLANATYLPSQSIYIAATVNDGNATGVDFRANGLVIATVPAPPYEFTWTNAPGGPHVLTATVIDEAGESAITSPLSIAVLSPYENFRRASFTPAQLLDPEVSDPGVDFDLDGYANFVEHYLAMNPTVADTPDLDSGFTTIGPEKFGTFSFRHSIAATDVTVVPEASLALTTWESGGNRLVQSSSVNHGDGTRTLTYRSLLPDQAREFFHLRLTGP